MPETSVVPGGALPVPPLTPPRRPRPLAWEELVLPTGLRVVAVSRPGVPMVELRLRIPVTAGDAGVRARGDVVGETLLAGTSGERPRDKVALAAAIQSLGASLSVSVDDDALRVSGSTLSEHLDELLVLARDVLTAPAFPADEVAGEAARLAERITIALSQAGVAAAEALGRRMYGDHPYGLGLPDPADVRAVTAEQAAAEFRAQVGPAGSTLLMVGDAEPARLLAAAVAALAAWSGGEPRAALPPAPAVTPGTPTLLVDRPASVQSSLRVGGVAPRRTDPGYPAFQLANLVFGGYFSSRLVTNLREEKGYTYSPHSVVGHRSAGSALEVEADVATDVTAPALAETWRELQRISTEPVGQEELDDAREYAIGSLAVGTASHAGLASTLSAVLASGAGVDYLAEHPGRLRAVTVADAAEQAARWLDPQRLVTVVVGDAAAVAGPLADLGSVETG